MDSRAVFARLRATHPSSQREGRPCFEVAPRARGPTVGLRGGAALARARDSRGSPEHALNASQGFSVHQDTKDTRKVRRYLCAEPFASSADNSFLVFFVSWWFPHDRRLIPRDGAAQRRQP